MPAWRWVSIAAVEAVHHAQLLEHGGAAGLRDRSMLESAMARPHNLVAYGEPDVADFAVAYAYGLARNHPFVDGNKRSAAVIAGTFLALNGYRLTCTD